jgi:hypothetical protein
MDCCCLTLDHVAIVATCLRKVDSNNKIQFGDAKATVHTSWAVVDSHETESERDGRRLQPDSGSQPRVNGRGEAMGTGA